VRCDFFDVPVQESLFSSGCHHRHLHEAGDFGCFQHLKAQRDSQFVARNNLLQLRVQDQHV